MEISLVIIFTKPDGTLRIRHVSDFGRLPNETDGQLVERRANENNPSGWPRRIAAKASLPHRRFRNAWRDGGGSIVIDLSEAKNGILDQVKTERVQRLNAVRSIEDFGEPQDRARVGQYRSDLGQLLNTVRAQIMNLSLTELEQYAIPWPTLPEAT